MLEHLISMNYFCNPVGVIAHNDRLAKESNSALQINRPFFKDEAKWIVLKHGEVKSVQRVAFRQQFCNSDRKKVPARLTFQRLLERFKNTGSLKPQQSSGRRPVTQDQIIKVEEFFAVHPDAHVREASSRLNIGFGTV